MVLTRFSKRLILPALFCLALLLALPRALADSSASCDSYLRPRVESQVRKLISDQKGLSRALLSVRAPRIESKVLKHCESMASCTEVDIAHAAQEVIEGIQTRDSRARGYAVLIGTMVGSAALTTELTAHLPPSAKFLTQLVGQIATIGIYVLGAPIWEPISSEFRRWAFGLSHQNLSAKAGTPESDELEAVWRATQATYSQNAQMSRNVISEFIQSARHNFSDALSANRDWEDQTGTDYAVDQIAEAAVRMRRLFAEIEPDDANVALAVRAAFTRHAREPGSLKQTVLLRIQEWDTQATQVDKVTRYYSRLLDAWLGGSSSGS